MPTSKTRYLHHSPDWWSCILRGPLGTPNCILDPVPKLVLPLTDPVDAEAALLVCAEMLFGRNLESGYTGYNPNAGSTRKEGKRSFPPGPGITPPPRG